MLRLLVSAIILACAVPAVCGKTKGEKEAQKELLARPSEVEINAASEQVKALLVDQMTANKWDISKDSQFQLVFDKAASGKSASGLMWGASLAGKNPSAMSINTYFSFVPREGATLVRFRFEITYTINEGRTVRQDAGERDYKPEILAVLDRIKEQFSTQQKDNTVAPAHAGGRFSFSGMFPRKSMRSPDANIFWISLTTKAIEPT